MLKNYVILLLAIILSCSKESIEPKAKSSLAFPLSERLDGEYYIYRTEIEDTVLYYSNAQTLLDFNASWGVPSGNIFNFEGDDFVDTPDLLNMLSGYGETYTPDWSLDDIIVDAMFSSGWMINIPGWEVAFLKVTPYDESCSCYTPETLNSFFLEGFKDGEFIKVWYH